MPIKEIKEKYENQLMAIPGVIGVGIGKKDDELVIKVLVIKKTAELSSKLPTELEGYQVVLEATGEIRAQ